MRSLSDSTTTLDLKKIQVNAQVTFMISILELVGNVVQVFLMIVYKANTFPTLIHAILCYLIVLPRTFLMNTSYNKNRIIEYGWQNMLRNLLGMAQNPPGCNESIIQQANGPFVPSKNPDLPHKRNIFVVSTSDKTTKPSNSDDTSRIKSQPKLEGLSCKKRDLKCHGKLTNTMKNDNYQRHLNVSAKRDFKSSAIERIEDEKLCIRSKKQHVEFQAGYQKHTELIDLEKESNYLFNYE